MSRRAQPIQMNKSGEKQPGDFRPRKPVRMGDEAEAETSSPKGWSAPEFAASSPAERPRMGAPVPAATPVPAPEPEPEKWEPAEPSAPSETPAPDPAPGKQTRHLNPLPSPSPRPAPASGADAEKEPAKTPAKIGRLPFLPNQSLGQPAPPA